MQERERAIVAEYEALRSDPEDRAWGALRREAEILVNEKAQKAEADRNPRVKWIRIHATLTATRLVQVLILALLAFAAGKSACPR